MAKSITLSSCMDIAPPARAGDTAPRFALAGLGAPRFALAGLGAPRFALAELGAPRFALRELAGRLVELSGDGASAVLTLAMRLVRGAQRSAEPVAWIGADDSTFYPPDAADSGIDLEALLIVRLPAKVAPASLRGGAGAQPLAQRIASAAERLLRSGAFGLAVLDLGKDAALTQPMQSRLLGLAQRHHAAVVCLTQKPESAPSLGSLVSLRAQAVRVWLGEDRFACELRVHKDKRHGPVWSEREVYRGPLGLR